MKSLRMIGVSIACSLLAACGGDGLEGKFEVSSAHYMGEGTSKSNIVVSSKGINTGSEKFAIYSWSKDGDIYTAMDEAGNDLIKLQEVDSDTYEVLNAPTETTWTRI